MKYKPFNAGVWLVRPSVFFYQCFWGTVTDSVANWFFSFSPFTHALPCLRLTHSLTLSLLLSPHQIMELLLLPLFFLLQANSIFALQRQHISFDADSFNQRKELETSTVQPFVQTSSSFLQSPSSVIQRHSSSVALSNDHAEMEKPMTQISLPPICRTEVGHDISYCLDIFDAIAALKRKRKTTTMRTLLNLSRRLLFCRWRAERCCRGEQLTQPWNQTFPSPFVTTVK